RLEEPRRRRPVHQLRPRRQAPGGDGEGESLRAEQRHRLRLPHRRRGPGSDDVAGEHQAPVLDQGGLGGEGRRPRQEREPEAEGALRRLDAQEVTADAAPALSAAAGGAGGGRYWRSRQGLALVASLGFFLAIYLYPLSRLLVWSFFSPGFTLEHYA